MHLSSKHLTFETGMQKAVSQRRRSTSSAQSARYEKKTPFFRKKTPTNRFLVTLLPHFLNFVQFIMAQNPASDPQASVVQNYGASHFRFQFRIDATFFVWITSRARHNEIITSLDLRGCPENLSFTTI